jgi:hypothetical protein
VADAEGVAELIEQGVWPEKWEASREPVWSWDKPPRQIAQGHDRC